MIISHSKKFIFVKPRKCASETIERILSMNLDENDITFDDEKINLGSKMFLLENLKYNIKNFIGSIVFFNKKHFKKIYNYKYEHEHLSIKEIKELVDKNIFNNYLKISILRNPINTFLSACNERYSVDNISLNDKVYKYAKKFLEVNQVYLIKGVPEIDFLIRYEKINDDFQVLLKLLKLDIKLAEYLKSIHFNKKENVNKNKFNKIHKISEYNIEAIDYILNHSKYFEIISKKFNYEKFYQNEINQIKSIVNQNEK